MTKALFSDPDDNVATMLADANAGDEVQATGRIGAFSSALTAASKIPVYHKIAIRPIKKGDLVIKYGSPIGAALCDILAGEHVHVHNLASIRARRDA